jgi:hypothetical protein
MPGMPIIRFEVEGMKHSISVALTEYAVKMDADIQAAIEAACTPEHLLRVIKDKAQSVIDRTIAEEVERFFRYGAGRAVIANAVQDILGDQEQIVLNQMQADRDNKSKCYKEIMGLEADPEENSNV